MAKNHLSVDFLRIPAASLAFAFASGSVLPLAVAQQAAAPAPAKVSGPTAPSPTPAPAPAPAPAAPTTTQPTGAGQPAAAPSAAASGSSAAAPAPQPDAKTKKQAKNAYSAGEAAFKKGKFEDAAASFKLADELIPSPQAKYWIAKTADAKSPDLTALAAYEAFLSSPDAAAAGEDKVGEATQRVQQLKAALYGKLTLTLEPANATLIVDGVTQPAAPSYELLLPAGPHTLRVEAAGFVAQDLQVQFASGQAQAQSVALMAEAPPPPPPPPPAAAPPAPPPPAPVASPPPQERSLVPAYVTLGIAAVGAGVGTYFGIQALSTKSDFDDHPSTDKANDVERNALIADMAFGVAVTLGITGVVLLTAPTEEEAAPKTAKAEPAKLQLAPYMSYKGGGAAARLTF